MLTKIEVPAECAPWAEKSIDHVEQALGLFFYGRQQVAARMNPTSQIPTQALSLSEQNMTSGIRLCSKISQTTDLQQAIRLQSEFMKQLLANAQHSMQQMSSTTAAKDKSRHYLGEFSADSICRSSARHWNGHLT